MRFDPPVQRPGVRITNLYGTTWEPVVHVDTSGTLTGHLRFGRLAAYYDKAADQLPVVAHREFLTRRRSPSTGGTGPGGW